MGSVKCLLETKLDFKDATRRKGDRGRFGFGWVSKEPKEGTKIRKYIRILTDWLYFLDTKIRYMTGGDIYLFLLRTFTHLPVDFKTFCLLILFFGKR
ncbi:unnamed protein product [Rhizophagus irregularis]|nr:unnamed protein product [Rhizophagus irregularis]